MRILMFVLGLIFLTAGPWLILSDPAEPAFDPILQVVMMLLCAALGLRLLIWAIKGNGHGNKAE